MTLNHLVPRLAVAARKQDDRETKLKHFRNWRVHVDHGVLNVIPFLAKGFSDRDRAILRCDATALAEVVRKGVYTAVDVLTAFIKAAVAAQDTTNCLTEICFEDALERARELDEHMEKTGNVVGPLHGVPVSIKDHIKVKGLDTSTGYTAWAYNTVAEEDALVVKILRDAGAIIYVKTQNPQTLLSLETNNNVFGRTCNPFNRSLTAGGSSGGEGALIACGGSPLGVGTDIGGSVRVPAAHCGLYGLKGSVARLPHSGLLGSYDGLDAIIGCVGPMATSARDLALFCSVMLEAEPWLREPPLLEMPWKENVARGHGLPERLSIAILYDDGVVRPHPPILQALDMYKQALENAGHEVIKWDPLDHQKGWDLIVKLYLLDGGAEYHETIQAGGEWEVPQSKWILDHARGRRPYTPHEILRLNVEREAFRANALAHWNATKHRTATGRPVDAILCPVAPTLAPPHDSTSWWGYTSHWNLLDLPAVVFPVGQYSAPMWVPADLSPPRNAMEDFITRQWSPDTYDHAPISLQLVGRRLNEERLLAILGVIENVMPPADSVPFSRRFSHGTNGHYKATDG
ncbi:amidase signature domain-containing protein [Pisolithus orientalis]|uniref:amidase signature domain-containing protein n=1 Tax=Pisolithus orientalis TaxID=936130 RepID=UPI00222464B9|nr:amidase signature domain-containing protein [Pisolithus orientalis]KAI6012455.1 amidase signature domain-containing protein [Pisolithus orientalis]